MSSRDKEMELESRAFEALGSIGIGENQTVLDFGCGTGMYTISAARIVGEQGRVYAQDKDNGGLDELMQKAESTGLRNIERMETSGEPKIELADESVDRVLLFDVLHSYYFSQLDERRRLLNEIHRVMRPTALLLLWPKHMESEARDEVEKAGFRLEEELSKILIHDSRDIEKGRILSFRKD